MYFSYSWHPFTISYPAPPPSPAVLCIPQLCFPQKCLNLQIINIYCLVYKIETFTPPDISSFDAIFQPCFHYIFYFPFSIYLSSLPLLLYLSNHLSNYLLLFIYFSSFSNSNFAPLLLYFPYVTRYSPPLLLDGRFLNTISVDFSIFFGGFLALFFMV